MIRAIIIDDEFQSAASLTADVKKYCPSIEIITTCLSAKEGLISIKKDKPDLIFLDVQMPWMNGFEMLEVIGEIDFNIIFTTAYDQFAAKAFRLNAIDYLLKPIDANELKDAIQKVMHKLELKHSPEILDNLVPNLKHPSFMKKVAVPNKDGYEFIEVNNISYCHAEGAYTKIYLDNGKYILISRSLRNIMDLLPHDLFFRIHHSIVVNIAQVTHFIRTDGGYIRMKTGEELAVSKSKREAVMERLGLR
jgi:two-component system, LytTR family, response regulator